MGANHRITSGQLRHRVTVQKPTTVLDGRGQLSSTGWTTVASGIPAAVQTLRGGEGELAQQRFPEATHEVTLRYRSDLLLSWRLKFGSRFFNISAIDSIDERDWQQRLIVGEEK